SKGGSGLLELRRLPPATSATPDAVGVDEPVLSIAETRSGLWALARDGSRSLIGPLDPTTGVFDRQRALELGRRFTASEMQGAGRTLWVEGTFRGSQGAIVRVHVRADGGLVANHPVLLHAPLQSDLLGLDGNHVLVAADGRLYRLNLGS